MADFKTPNLCGANETLNDALSKIKNLKDEILAQSTALPSVRMISILISSMMKTIGPSHHFLRVLRKSKNSASMANLLSKSGG